MLREELIFVATCDISGHARGKGFPAKELHARRTKGIGWTHSNLMMSAFGPIWDTPFGTGGDLMIVPDQFAEVRVDFADGSLPEHFFLGTPTPPTHSAAPAVSARFFVAALGAAGFVPDTFLAECGGPDGIQPVAMTRGNAGHNRITTNVHAAL